jgi:hypothetical protein
MLTQMDLRLGGRFIQTDLSIASTQAINSGAAALINCVE